MLRHTLAGGALRIDMRSLSAGNDIIVFRSERETVQIIRLIERHRDIASQFDPLTDQAHSPRRHERLSLGG